jgi:hypothetical protein
VEELKKHVILATRNSKVAADVIKLIADLPRVKQAAKEGVMNDNVDVEPLPFTNGYYIVYLRCRENLSDYLNGFCCGYMAGIDFDNA